MLDQSHPKIIGAFLLGFALVAGTYTYKTFGQSNFAEPVANVASAAAPRVAIAVTDSDGDGVEDWRDQFVSAESVVIETTTNPRYEQPETLTGELGIALFENIIRARNGGPFSQTEEEVIANTVAVMADETAMEVYDLPDIQIMETWTDADIRNYGNAMAGAILSNNVEGIDNEVDILNDILNRNKPERISELNVLANIYKGTRDDSLLIPVPRIFMKQHLDLINTYQAIYVDIDAMTLSVSDPARALLRIKRYQDDSTGLHYALENMSLTLAAYPELFTTTDQANFFTLFNPNLQTN